MSAAHAGIEKVLVVDDEEMIRDFIRRVLEKRNYSVKTVGNGTLAMELLSKETFSFIISDLKMPEMTGIELVERIKSFYPSLDIIIITGSITDETVKEAKHLGVKYCLIKPFGVDELFGIVDKCLANRNSRKGH